MKRFFVVLVMMSFVLSVTGLVFAQTPSSTALEKASDSATFKRDDSNPASKPDAEKMKADKEKAIKEKAEKEKAGKGKAAEEKGAQEKALQQKGKAGQEKNKLKPEDVKKP